MDAGYILTIGGGSKMSFKFIEPAFDTGHLEFRTEENEVCIYGDEEGLRWLAQKCLALVDARQKNHLHLGDYQVLTRTSQSAVIALYPE